MMVSNPFWEFEHAGWSNDALAVSYHRHLGEVTARCVPDLIRAVNLKAGDEVLDVACGAGYVAAAARNIGADPIGVDFSAAQVRLARQTHPLIRFIEGDAEVLPFADRQFDVVLNAFGMPHVPHPPRAAAEAFRVLKPDGRFAYASWCEATKCIGISMVYDAIREHGSIDVGLPPGPNFFSCGDLSFASELLSLAGFRNISATEVPLVWRVPSPEAFIEAISTGTVRAAAVLNRQNPASLANIKQYLRKIILSFEHDGGYAVPMPALVVTAHKSAH
jgi:SAM-dependent methyltransferase